MFDMYDDEEFKNLQAEKKQKKYLGILFECCGVYARIYQNKEGTAYIGRCPKCMKEVRVPIGKNGTGQRFFRGR